MPRGEGGGFTEKEIRHAQAEAARIVQQKQAKRDALTELRRQPVERIRKPGEGLDSRQVFGSYYTGDQEIDQIAARQNKVRPRIQQFGDIYPADKITADVARVESFRQSPHYREERGADTVAAEYVVNELFNRGQFGQGARAIPSADYDDYFNHIDTVVAIDETDGSVQYLAVDVTTSPDPDTHKKKLYQTIDLLKQNELNAPEYFLDPKHPEQKGKKPMPRVVISLKTEKEKMAELMAGKLPAEMRHEKEEEIIMQLSQDTAFLLKQHYRAGQQFELAGNDPEAVMDFFNTHAGTIERQDRKLYENVLAHVKLLGRYLLEEKKAGPARRDINGGPLWKLVHDGRLY
jgi:hypothetical protein